MMNFLCVRVNQRKLCASVFPEPAVLTASDSSPKCHEILEPGAALSESK